MSCENVQKYVNTGKKTQYLSILLIFLAKNMVSVPIVPEFVKLQCDAVEGIFQRQILTKLVIKLRIS